MRELLEGYKAKIVDGIPESNLVAFYPALHGLGGSLLDRSRNANHGTISGASWKRLPSGLYVLSFDGSNDNVAIVANITKGLTAITALIWVKPTDVSATKTLMGDYTSATDNSFTAEVYDNAATSTWRTRGQLKGATLARTSIYGNSATVLPYNTWALWGITWNGSLAIPYVNGIADSAGTAFVDSSLQPTVTLNTFIGAYASGTNKGNVTGSIGLVCIYSRALTATEILRHYTRERHLFRV